ncbi:MAG: hypothetical protein JXA81_09480 [Sedimentisphaerales bacterium]|nr:hypothetical protein [Sedimentisphaerales bacterium]
MFFKKFTGIFICLALALSFSITVAKGANILFISAMDEATGPGDEALRVFIEGLGHTVIMFDDDETEADTEVAAAEADLVFISESVSSSKIREEITEIETPMVITESWGWDEMGLITGGGEDAPDVATTNIEIVEPGHPLAAGLSGTASVLTDIASSRGPARFGGHGAAGSAATVIATAKLSDGLTWDIIFVYEKGAQLPVPPADGSPQVAADMRICLGFDEQSYLVWNENAYLFLEAAINYALGLKPQPKAGIPKPYNGEVDVAQEALLSWKKGAYAVTHNVYFGKTVEDVNAADPTNPLDVLVGENQTINAYDPYGLLDFGGTYYWRVDEVNDLDPNSPWRGDLWSFTVINYFIVDDFEGYTDYTPNDIFSSWSDGFGTDENGALVGYDNPDFDAGEHFLETMEVKSGTQSLPYFYNNIPPATYSEATLAFSEPQDWTKEGVKELSLWFKGNPPYTGSFLEAPVGTYTMTGSGTDIWGKADEFHFAFKEFAGAGTIIAKVESIDPVNANKDTKAGVMIRDSLEPGSTNTALLCTLDPEKGLRFQNRSVLNDTTAREDADMDPNAIPPYWLKLQRTSGGLIRAYRSPDGIKWTQFGLKQISMEEPMYIGLAVTSHDAGMTSKAVFSNVSFHDTNVDILQWTDQDIGMLSNEPESMYVILDGSAKIYYDDPNATLINDWTEWTIPLQNFADRGIDLTSVNSIGIGIGDKDNPQQDGGSGTMYFDDIRLYLPRSVETKEIVVENFSFELPGTEKIKGWNGEGVAGTPAVDIPGWSSDAVVVDSGVETGYTPTDGDWTAFLMSGDPSVWQSTDYTIAEGDIFELKVDARITWAATNLQMILYYDDSGARIPAVTSEVTLTDDMQEYALSLSAADVPESVGKNIGIELSNSSSGDSWIGLDNIRLVVSKE